MTMMTMMTLMMTMMTMMMTILDDLFQKLGKSPKTRRSLKNKTSCGGENDKNKTGSKEQIVVGGLIENDNPNNELWLQRPPL